MRLEKRKRIILTVAVLSIAMVSSTILYAGIVSFVPLKAIKENSIIKTKPLLTAPKEWTFMVYLDADNDLEKGGIEDLNEMEQVGSDSNINIIVQIDRIPGFDNSNGNWNGTKRYYIIEDSDHSIIGSPVIQDLGEVNMGDVSTLESFIQWGKMNYPANKYALILWDHGSGIMYDNSLGGVCWDDSDNYDYLNLSEIASVLSNNPINLLGFDACLMGAMEVHYQLKDYIDILVAAELSEPMGGYPYDDVLYSLRRHPTCSPEQLGEDIVINYNRFYSIYDYIGQSAFKPITTEFINTLNIFISDLNLALDTQRINIERARVVSQFCYKPEYIDLYDFAKEIRSLCYGSIDTSALNLMNAIKSIMIEEGHSKLVYGAHGLSIYFPKYDFEYYSNYESCLFAQDLQWDEFLNKFYTSGGQSDDIYEENDDFSEAEILTEGYYSVNILNGFDQDYFNISVNSGYKIDVDILFDNSEGDLNLYLYNTIQDLVDNSISTTNNEHIGYNATSNGFYTIVIDSDTDDPLQPYDLIISTYIPETFEVNDEFSEATILTAGHYNNLLGGGYDQDYFNISVNSGDKIKVDILFNHSEGDLNLYLYNTIQTLTDSSTSYIYNNEQIRHVATSSGYYTILIKSKSHDPNQSYKLKINITADDFFEENNDFSEATILRDGNYMDLHLAGFSQDYFNVSLNAGNNIEVDILFSHSEGDINLYLYNTIQTLVDSSTSTTDNEHLSHSATQIGYYTIVVDSDSDNLLQPYELIINTLGDDAFEENDFWYEAPLITEGYYNNLFLNDSEADYFNISLNSGNEIIIDVVFDYGVVNYFLTGPNLYYWDSLYYGNPMQITVPFSGIYTLSIACIFGTPSQHYDLLIDISYEDIVDDFFEENDWFDEAPLITEGYYSNLIRYNYDEDYFNVSVNSGDIIDIDILFNHRKGDLDLYLYNPTQTRVTYSTSTTDNEHVSYVAMISGYYSIRVNSYSYEYSQPYELKINIYRVKDLNAPIHIDDTNPDYNWSKTAAENEWCSGSGIYTDPYVIQDLTIDAGDSGSGILIENSKAYFRIENCTVYNSGSDWMDAGIKLNNTSNGEIINNNCSQNSFGIYLNYSNNNTISGNTANNNNIYGIYLRYSDDNTISGNTAKNNNNVGIVLAFSDYNTISGNTVKNNSALGILLWNSSNNIVSGNTTY